MYALTQEVHDTDTLKREFLTLLWERDHISGRLTNRVRPLPLELRNKVDENLSKVNGLLSICDEKFIQMKDCDFWQHELLAVDINFFLEKIKTYVEDIKRLSGIKVTPY